MRDMDADGVVSDSSEEQEGDVLLPGSPTPAEGVDPESGPVENSPLGSDNVQSQGSAVGEQDINRSYSPYVPDNALEAGTPTTTYTEIPQDATTGAVRSTRSPPPAYPGAQASAGNGPHPPAHGQLPPLRGSIKPRTFRFEVDGAANSDQSADESSDLLNPTNTANLAQQTPGENADAAMELEAMNAEVTEDQP